MSPLRGAVEVERSRRSGLVRRMSDPMAFVLGVSFIAFGGGLSIDTWELDVGLVRWLGAGLLYLFGLVLLYLAKTYDR